MPFAIKPILPIEICSVICPCHFHHNSALPVNELPSSRKNWLANSLLPVPSLPFSLAKQCSPTRPPQVLDHQTVSAGEGSQHEGNHSQGALANPLKLCCQSFKTKYGNFCLRRQSRRRRPPSWMRRKVTESQTQTPPSLVSSLPILY